MKAQLNTQPGTICIAESVCLLHAILRDSTTLQHLDPGYFLICWTAPAALIADEDASSLKKFTKIKKERNLYQEVMKAIKAAILSGTYPSGSPLPSETELARQFEVSRPVIREALRALQSNGFVDIKRGTKGGTFIRDLTRLPLLDDLDIFILHRHFRVDHLAQVRLFLEPEVSRLAAANATQTDIQAMKDLVNTYADVGDPDEKDRLYCRFHRLVGRSCGNPIFALLMLKYLSYSKFQTGYTVGVRLLIWGLIPLQSFHPARQ